MLCFNFVLLSFNTLANTEDKFITIEIKNKDKDGSRWYHNKNPKNTGVFIEKFCNNCELIEPSSDEDIREDDNFFIPQYGFLKFKISDDTELFNININDSAGNGIIFENLDDDNNIQLSRSASFVDGNKNLYVQFFITSDTNINRLITNSIPTGEEAVENQFVTNVGQFSRRVSNMLGWTLETTNEGFHNNKIEYLSLIIRDTVNILMLFAILGLAVMFLFSNFLPKQSTKKTMILLFFAMIMVNFSLPFVRLTLDGFNVLQKSFLSEDITEDQFLRIQNLSNVWIGKSVATMQPKQIQSSGGDIEDLTSLKDRFVDIHEESTLFHGGLILLLSVGQLFIVLLLVFRIVIMWFLIILSPLLAFLPILPLTSGVFRHWLWFFGRWLAIGPLVAICLFSSVSLWQQTGIPVESKFRTTPGIDFLPNQTNIQMYAPGVSLSEEGNMSTATEIMKFLIGIVMIWMSALVPLWLTKSRKLTNFSLKPFLPKTLVNTKNRSKVNVNQKENSPILPDISNLAKKVSPIFSKISKVNNINNNPSDKPSLGSIFNNEKISEKSINMDKIFSSNDGGNKGINIANLSVKTPNLNIKTDNPISFSKDKKEVEKTKETRESIKNTKEKNEERLSFIKDKVSSNNIKSKNKESYENISIDKNDKSEKNEKQVSSIKNQNNEKLDTFTTNDKKENKVQSDFSEILEKTKVSDKNNQSESLFDKNIEKTSNINKTSDFVDQYIKEANKSTATIENNEKITQDAKKSETNFEANNINKNNNRENTKSQENVSEKTSKISLENKSDSSIENSNIKTDIKGENFIENKTQKNKVNEKSSINESSESSTKIKQSKNEKSKEESKKTDFDNFKSVENKNEKNNQSTKSTFQSSSSKVSSFTEEKNSFSNKTSNISDQKNNISTDNNDKKTTKVEKSNETKNNMKTKENIVSVANNRNKNTKSSNIKSQNINSKNETKIEKKTDSQIKENVKNKNESSNANINIKKENTVNKVDNQKNTSSTSEKVVSNNTNKNQSIKNVENKTEEQKTESTWNRIVNKNKTTVNTNIVNDDDSEDIFVENIQTKKKNSRYINEDSADKNNYYNSEGIKGDEQSTLDDQKLLDENIEEESKRNTLKTISESSNLNYFDNDSMNNVAVNDEFDIDSKRNTLNSFSEENDINYFNTNSNSVDEKNDETPLLFDDEPQKNSEGLKMEDNINNNNELIKNDNNLENKNETYDFFNENLEDEKKESDILDDFDKLEEEDYEDIEKKQDELLEDLDNDQDDNDNKNDKDIFY